MTSTYARPVVEIRDVTKRFGATQALAGVSFDVKEGEILGLVGANGAGKSTLIKILAGLQPATSGDIVVDGAVAHFATPVDAMNRGVVTVHQNIDDGVVFGLTVAQNLVIDELGRPRGNPFVTNGSIRRRARQILDDLELDLPLDELVEQIPASSRQQISIARALVKRPKLLILDEPTSTLSTRESELLFGAVHSMKASGIAVLYVSHHMSEVQALCDRAVVLRNGRVVSTHQTPLDPKAIATSILGDLVITERTAQHRDGGDRALVATSLRVKPDAPGIDLTFRRGEIVGITGLVGAGKTELLEQVGGSRPLVSGRMELNGREYRPRTAADAVAAGVVMMPEERAAQAIFPGDSISEHCSIGRLRAVSRSGFMSFAAERAFAREVIDSVKVVASGPDAAIETLSGGNQQKVLVGRWLQERHELVLLDEPFRGIDIGARAIIGTALREYSAHAAVVVASSDPEEVIEVADRVLVMVEGVVVRDVPAHLLSAEELADIMSAPMAQIGGVS